MRRGLWCGLRGGRPVLGGILRRLRVRLHVPGRPALTLEQRAGLTHPSVRVRQRNEGRRPSELLALREVSELRIRIGLLAARRGGLVLLLVPGAAVDARRHNGGCGRDLGNLRAEVVGLVAREDGVPIDRGLKVARQELLDLARGHQLRGADVRQLGPGRAGLVRDIVLELVAAHARRILRHHAVLHVLLRELRRLARLARHDLGNEVVGLRAEDLPEEAHALHAELGVVAQRLERKHHAVRLGLAQADAGLLQKVGVPQQVADVRQALVLRGLHRLPVLPHLHRRRDERDDLLGALQRHRVDRRLGRLVADLGAARDRLERIQRRLWLLIQKRQQRLHQVAARRWRQRLVRCGGEHGRRIQQHGFFRVGNWHRLAAADDPARARQAARA